MARTKEIISLDAHAESVRERLLRFERNIELEELDEAMANLIQSKATIAAMEEKLTDLCFLARKS